MGRAGRPDAARAKPGGGRAIPDELGALPAAGCQSRGGACAVRDEFRDRRAADPGERSRPDPGPAQDGRQGSSGGIRALPGRADPWRDARRDCPASTTCHGSATRTGCWARSRSSSPASGPFLSSTACWRRCCSPTSWARRAAPPRSAMRHGRTFSRRTTRSSASSSARHGGREINTAGDGFLATFDGPARAIRCALASARRRAGWVSRSGPACTPARSKWPRRMSGVWQSHRRPDRSTGWRWRGAGLADGQGSRGWLWPELQRTRPDRAQRGAGRMGALRGGRPELLLRAI